MVHAEEYFQPIEAMSSAVNGRSGSMLNIAETIESFRYESGFRSLIGFLPMACLVMNARA